MAWHETLLIGAVALYIVWRMATFLHDELNKGLDG